MKSVTDIAREIVTREGGFVNDPDDPGGATKYGVTLGTLKRLGIDLTNDRRTDIADVKALTRDRAVQIFVEDYFIRKKLADLP
ncbi:MAG TPA: glycosyl hydrolase 108 family protein, partial [Paracoccaceae bacterium]|nr:glycosyl hydrolase 108 family protein [Paracoccaceae bacterium]